RQKQKKLIMLLSETMIWQPEFTDKTFSRKLGAVHPSTVDHDRMFSRQALTRDWGKKKQRYVVTAAGMLRHTVSVKQPVLSVHPAVVG
ncbi:hypothetical protein, partial [Shigella flexneri]|uniref:hypothetical protein n=1 Tax=Shigella flexneri TaxID=623 RepID=UPI001C0A850C